MGSSYREEINKYKHKKRCASLDDAGVVPHKKKKHKQHKKSSHKHKYIPAIYYNSYSGFNSNGKKQEYITCGSHCKICGRVSDMSFIWFNTEDRIEKFKKEHPDYIEMHLPENWDYFRDKYVPI